MSYICYNGENPVHETNEERQLVSILKRLSSHLMFHFTDCFIVFMWHYFSASEQSHWAEPAELPCEGWFKFFDLTSCMRLWMNDCKFTLHVINICWSGVLTGLFGYYMAGTTWNCCHLGACSVYTIQPVYSFIWSDTRRVHVCLARKICHLHLWQNHLDRWENEGWTEHVAIRAAMIKNQHKKLTLKKKITPTATARNWTCNLLITNMVPCHWAPPPPV